MNDNEGTNVAGTRYYGGGVLGAMLRSDLEEGKRAILTALVAEAGNVSAAQRRLRYCCKPDFFRLLKKLDMMGDVKRIREAAVLRYRMSGAPIRKWWDSRFHAEKEAEK